MLLVTLLLSLLVLGLGLAALYLVAAKSRQRSPANLKHQQQALYAAEAGIEHALRILGRTQSWPDLLAKTCGPGRVGGKGTVLCDGQRAVEKIPAIQISSSTARRTTQVGIGYTVYLQRAPAGVPDGGPAADGGPAPALRLRLRSEAVGRDGTRYIAIEALVRKTPAGRPPAVDAWRELR